MSPVIKRKRERVSLPSKYWLLILTILCIGMMLLSFTTDLFSGPLNSIAGYTVVPFQEGISTVGRFFSDKAEQFASLSQVLEENALLKEQVDQLTVENTQLQQDKYELSTLRALYQLDAAYEDYEKTGARIIAKDPGNWFSGFIIDKGEKDGIEVDFNVIADGGLVGRVTEVGPNYARVVSIISDNSNVSAEILATSDTLIVSGDLEAMSQGVISFQQLADKEDNVMEGDKIVTSSISEKYLPGILIGYVSSINKDSNNLTKSGTLTPAVDFSHMREVLVIMQKKQQVP